MTVQYVRIIVPLNYDFILLIIVDEPRVNLLTAEVVELFDHRALAKLRLHDVVLPQLARAAREAFGYCLVSYDTTLKYFR